jgi:hypothetical protein
VSSLRPLLPVVLLLGLVPGGCRARPEDGAMAVLSRTLQPGDRLLFFQALEADPILSSTGGFVIVVRPASGRPELRVFEKRSEGAGPVYVTQQGDTFHGLVLEDVNGDGRAEIVSRWGGGHLELVEVTARAADGSFAPIFQNGGRRIEEVYGLDDTIHFLITSRTYEEGAGEPPSYETTLYRWDGQEFTESGQ